MTSSITVKEEFRKRDDDESRDAYALALNNRAYMAAQAYTATDDRESFDVAEALEQSRKSIELQKVDDDPVTMDTFGYLLLLNGQAEEAVTHLERAVELTQVEQNAQRNRLQRSQDERRSQDILRDVWTINLPLSCITVAKPMRPSGKRKSLKRILRKLCDWATTQTKESGSESEFLSQLQWASIIGTRAVALHAKDAQREQDTTSNGPTRHAHTVRDLKEFVGDLAKSHFSIPYTEPFDTTSLGRHSPGRPKNSTSAAATAAVITPSTTTPGTCHGYGASLRCHRLLREAPYRLWPRGEGSCGGG